MESTAPPVIVIICVVVGGRGFVGLTGHRLECENDILVT
jgi:hypothetical protein